jgi:8-oxo-dGTP pyrophosphatase MutT (NUDIX family)
MPKTFTLDKKDPASFPFNSIMVSAIIERINPEGEIEILLQSRMNSNDSVYYGTLEIPAGHINKWENVYDTLAREVLEETGLQIIEVLGDEQTKVVSGNGQDAAFAFKPFMCQQYLRGQGWSWIGFAFRCHVADGEIKAQPGETAKHQWIKLAQLQKMIEEDKSKFFTLQLPVLQSLLDFHKSN